MSEQEELNIPSWQMDLVRVRMEEYKNQPYQAIDFDQTIEEIEEEL